MSAQDTQVIRNVVGRYVGAAKNPKVSAINRLMTRLKPAIADYLNEQTGIDGWKPSSYVDEKHMTMLSYTEHRCVAVSDRHVQWSLAFKFYPGSGDSYEMIVTAMKGQRILDSFRQADISIQDIKNPRAIATPEMIKALNASLEGDYSKETEELTAAVEELEENAGKALANAKEIAALIKAGDLVKAHASKAFQELEWMGRDLQSGAQTVKSQLQTIIDGR
jgi:hypothetical protein